MSDINDVKKEIRRILLGYIAYYDTCIVAARESVKMRMLGTFNGTGFARVFGVTAIKRRYRFSEEESSSDVLSKEEKKKNRKTGDTRKKQRARKLLEEGDKSLQNLGRRVLLDADPDQIATFYAPVLYNPSVLLLSLDKEEEAVEMTVVTARTLIARLNAAHAFWKWSRNIPYELERLDVVKIKKAKKDATDEDKKVIEKTMTKEEKKAYKAEMKERAAAEKKERKKQKMKAKLEKLQAALDEEPDEETPEIDETEE